MVTQSYICISYTHSITYSHMHNFQKSIKIIIQWWSNNIDLNHTYTIAQLISPNRVTGPYCASHATCKSSATRLYRLLLLDRLDCLLRFVILVRLIRIDRLVFYFLLVRFVWFIRHVWIYQLVCLVSHDWLDYLLWFLWLFRLFQSVRLGQLFQFV